MDPCGLVKYSPLNPYPVDKGLEIRRKSNGYLQIQLSIWKIFYLLIYANTDVFAKYSLAQIFSPVDIH
jgi:hypothetical protein